MKPESFTFGTALRVSWVDSAMRRGWSHPASDGPYEPQSIVTQGFVVEASANGLTLSSSIDDTKQVIAPLIIPWGCIRSCEILPEEYHI